MKCVNYLLVLTAFLLCFKTAISQEEKSESVKKKVLDTLTYEQQSGLPVAASKIYFSDKKFTISGFGESNYNHYLGPKNRESNDLELYNTHLQRFVLYGAYKPVDWMILYGEFFAEFLNDGTEESDFEYLPEVFVDFLIDPRFNVRVGSHQPGIGYINNNDEPILFYTVNRPEVERLLIPSQWIDLGVMTYGKINNDLNWTASVYQGLDAENLNGATWVRRGRDDALRFNFNSYLLNGKLAYTGIKNTEVALSGFFAPLGLGETTQINGVSTDVKANTFLTSAYVRYTKNNFSFMTLGTYGQVNNTDQLFHLTSHNGPGTVLGESVYGFYTELSYDLLPLFGFNPTKEGGADNFLVKRKEFKMPIFTRLERLNTHASIHESLINETRSQSDLTALSVGLNFNTKRNIVFKANYQFRWNKEPLQNGMQEGDRIEMGLGFIF